LPSEPKIFHGRETEVDIIIRAIGHDLPRIAILGAGGMGKTTLARAVLHHPYIIGQYKQHRFFVACDTVTTGNHLATLIGAHIGLKSGSNLTQPVIYYFAASPRSLLVLDNLETVWEPQESRGDVENLLSFLA
ncbi:hypothetical protein C8R43DRAFT_817862, partial [Mycena crocata]